MNLFLFSQLNNLLTPSETFAFHHWSVRTVAGVWSGVPDVDGMWRLLAARVSARSPEDCVLRGAPLSAH